MSTRLPALTRQQIESDRWADIADLIDPDTVLCRRCEASYPLDGDDLCSECRHDVDVEYGDLPGAGA